VAKKRGKNSVAKKTKKNGEKMQKEKLEKREKNSRGVQKGKKRKKLTKPQDYVLGTLRRPKEASGTFQENPAWGEQKIEKELLDGRKERKSQTIEGKKCSLLF